MYEMKSPGPTLGGQSGWGQWAGVAEHNNTLQFQDLFQPRCGAAQADQIRLPPWSPALGALALGSRAGSVGVGGCWGNETGLREVLGPSWPGWGLGTRSRWNAGITFHLDAPLLGSCPLPPMLPALGQAWLAVSAGPQDAPS
jgi:hypothetical protein